MSSEDCQSYEKIKSAVLKAYECVPEAYRQRFRACRKEHKQSHLEFVQDLRKYFTHWYTALDIKSFDDLVQLMILEPFKISVPDNIATYIKNQNQKNQKELYCQVCLHTQGICLGVRSFQYRNNTVQTDNSANRDNI